MAKVTKPKSKAKTKEWAKRAVDPVVEKEMPVWMNSAVEPAKSGAMEDEGEALDPQEEKVLDWILKGVVGFVLAWLGISVLMVIGGFFHLWG